MNKYFRIILVLAFIPVLATLLWGCEGKASKYTSYPLYNETANPTPYMLSDGKTAGVFINSTKAFCGFEVTLTTVAQSENNVTLCVYEYTIDYQTSISRSPVAYGVFDNVKAGEKLYLQFEDLAAGRYILTVSSTGTDIGIYRHASIPSVGSKAHFYYHLLKLESGAFPFTVTFRTANVKGLEAADVLATPDYSWATDGTPSGNNG
jgi:hypothetical protein